MVIDFLPAFHSLIDIPIVLSHLISLTGSPMIHTLIANLTIQIDHNILILEMACNGLYLISIKLTATNKPLLFELILLLLVDGVHILQVDGIHVHKPKQYKYPITRIFIYTEPIQHKHNKNNSHEYNGEHKEHLIPPYLIKEVAHILHKPQPDIEHTRNEHNQRYDLKRHNTT